MGNFLSAKMYGRQGLERAIRSTVAAQKDEITDAIRGLANDIAQLATQLAPARPTSGRLKRSIRVEEGEGKGGPTFAILAGDETAFYARFVERGQGWDKIPRPYMENAFNAYREQARPRIERAIRKGLRPSRGRPRS